MTATSRCWRTCGVSTEENRVLREQLIGCRLRFTDDQRRRLAVRAKGLGRKLLAEVARMAKMLNQVLFQLVVGDNRAHGQT